MRHSVICFSISLLVLVSCSSSDDGERKGEKKYNQDPYNGVLTTFYEDGKTVRQTFEMKDSLKHGKAVQYYENGDVNTELYYERNLRQDTAYYFYKSGKLHRKTPYVDDQRHGVQLGYGQDGRLLYEMPYSNGDPVAGLKMFEDDSTVKEEPKIVFERSAGGKYKVSTEPSFKNVQYYETRRDGYGGRSEYSTTAKIASKRGKCEISSPRMIAAKVYAPYKTVYILFGQP